MANTEIMSVLKRVRKAQDAVTDALDKSGLTQPQRNLLDELSDFLRDLDNTYMNFKLKTGIDKLAKKSKKFGNLNKKTQKELKELKKVAKAVDTAAKVNDALVKAFDILAKAGIA